MMPRVRSSAGYTLLEMVIATFLALVVVLAMGRLILANQRSWEWGRDKAVLQQNVTETLEWMARSVRAARHLAVTDSTQFATYDETGSLVHTFALVNVGGEDRLQQDGSDLIDRTCVRFAVIPDPDTTSVTLEVELEDPNGNRVAAATRAAMRNVTLAF